MCNANSFVVMCAIHLHDKEGELGVELHVMNLRELLALGDSVRIK